MQYSFRRDYRFCRRRNDDHDSAHNVRHHPPPGRAYRMPPDDGGMTTVLEVRRYLRSEHAIADREGVMQLGARLRPVRGGDAIGQMPRPELIGVAWACRQPQLELALGLARQIQDHERARWSDNPAPPIP